MSNFEFPRDLRISRGLEKFPGGPPPNRQFPGGPLSRGSPSPSSQMPPSPRPHTLGSNASVVVRTTVEASPCCNLHSSNGGFWVERSKSLKFSANAEILRSNKGGYWLEILLISKSLHQEAVGFCFILKSNILPEPSVQK